MPFGSVDPANLDGEGLDRWYRRSPDEIERVRQRDDLVLFLTAGRV